MKFMKKIDSADVLICLGITEISVGLWLYAPWISLTVCGSIVLLLGLRELKK